MMTGINYTDMRDEAWTSWEMSNLQTLSWTKHKPVACTQVICYKYHALPLRLLLYHYCNIAVTYTSICFAGGRMTFHPSSAIWYSFVQPYRYHDIVDVIANFDRYEWTIAIYVCWACGYLLYLNAVLNFASFATWFILQLSFCNTYSINSKLYIYIYKDSLNCHVKCIQLLYKSHVTLGLCQMATLWLKHFLKWTAQKEHCIIT